MTVQEALWIGDPKTAMPWEYTELRLCRDVYHCDRRTLDEQDYFLILQDLEFMKAENRVRAMDDMPGPSAPPGSGAAGRAASRRQL